MSTFLNFKRHEMYREKIRPLVLVVASSCFSFPAAVYGQYSAASLVSPAPGSVLSGSSVNFSWTAGTGVSGYTLTAISAAGVPAFSSGTLSTTSITATGLPTDGSTLYINLCSQIKAVWQCFSYTYTAAHAAVATLTVNATSLAFGSVGVGTPATKTLTLSSTGTAAVTVQSAKVTGTGFTVSGATFPLTLSPGKTQTLTVQFKPAAVGAVTGQLSIASNSSTNPSAAIALSGTGVSSPVATLSINAASVPFGDVTVNTAATQSLILTSKGTAAVTVQSAKVTGAGFTISGAVFPLTLSPGKTQTLELQFDPAAAGVVTGQLTITSNSSTSPTAVIALSGTGVSGSYQVALTWSAPGSSPLPIAGYHVYRSAGGSSSYQLLNSSADKQTSYTDGTVQNGSNYSYTVRSVSSSGVESAPSNTISVSIP